MALSLGAIGLWFFAPNRTPNPALVTPAAPQPPTPRPQLPRIDRFPERAPGQAAPLPAPPEGALSAPRPGTFDPRGLSRTGNGKISPSTQALADRLHLEPQILAQTFADESGELPRDVAKRLEHAFDSASALAKQRKLDESQSQSVVAILTYYEFSVLREEKAAAPGPAVPNRLERLGEEMLPDIQTTGGEDTRKAAEQEIERW